MKSTPILAGLALALAGAAVPAVAQQGGYSTAPYGTQNTYNGAYNTNGMWQGAPDGLSQRIDWLQNRINQGQSDGSLDRAEARRAQLQLNQLRRDASLLQQRLDTMTRGIRWARGNGGYGSQYGSGYGTQDPYATQYDARQYYRDDPRYQERVLTSNDEVFRGSDGRYYCKRSDGTTGLVIGGVGGAALGNIIDGGHSRVAGTLIGGALGALLGRTVQQQSTTDVRCR